MPSFFRFLLLLLATAGAALAAGTKVATDQPIVNFRIPDFTPEGNRAWLVRGSEARYISDNQVDVKSLNLSIFTGLPDGKVETLILSPTAVLQPAESVVTGQDTIRVINDEFEATGTDWRYIHKEKRVSIAKNVRVTFHAELKDFLK